MTIFRVRRYMHVHAPLRKRENGGGISVYITFTKETVSFTIQYGTDLVQASSFTCELSD